MVQGPSSYFSYMNLFGARGESKAEDILFFHGDSQS